MAHKHHPNRMHALLIAMCFSAFGPADATEPLRVGDRAPAVLGIASDGDTSTVNPWKWGNRYTLLVFWSHDDAACVVQLEELRRLHRQLAADKEFQVVSLATLPPGQEVGDHDWNRWVDFLRRQPDVVDKEGEKKFFSAWPQLFEAELFDPQTFPPDENGLTTSGRYGVHKLPAAFLVRPDGRLAAVHIPVEQLYATIASFVAPHPAKSSAIDPQSMQELFDLSARKTQVLLELRYIDKRLAELEKEQFADFERVADPLGSDYWESISDVVLHARSTRAIRAGELLLYHAPGIYRVKGKAHKLLTNGECWYFRPDRDIASGTEFTIVPHYDDKSVKPRDPQHPYQTRIDVSNR